MSDEIVCGICGKEGMPTETCLKCALEMDERQSGLIAEIAALKKRNKQLEVYVDNTGPKYVRREDYDALKAENESLRITVKYPPRDYLDGDYDG